MSRLIPETRINVNGVAVIKHVRVDGKTQQSVSSLPAPSLASKAEPATKAKSASKARTEQRRWMQNPQKSSPADKDLKAVAKKRFPSGGFTCQVSDVEAYEVMSVTSPKNAMLVIACGARTPEEAVAFLEENDLGHLIEDHSSLANAALAQNIPAEALVDVCSDLDQGYWLTSNFLDAVEAYSVKALRGKADGFSGIPFRILHGEIDLSDVKTVGASRLGKEGTPSVAIRQLAKIKAGDSLMDVKELGDLLTKFNPRNVKGGADEAIQMAAKYGADLMLGIRDEEWAFDLERRLRRSKYPVDEIPTFIRWNDQLQRIDHHPLSSERIVMLQRTGITPERASELLNRNLEPEQIVAVVEQDIAATVAEGWL